MSLPSSTPNPNKDTYIVALTANVEANSEDMVKSAGMSAFLSKPVRINQITSAILDACPPLPLLPPGPSTVSQPASPRTVESLPPSHSLSKSSGD